MSNNFLASYFTNADASGTTDLVGKSFFDLISECKDFSKCLTSLCMTN